jgi:site-specific recombinase XerD
MKTNIAEINEYITTLKLDKSSRTIVSYEAAIQKLIRFLNIQTFEDLKNVTPSNLRELQNNMKESGLQASSINANMRPLKAMFNWFVENQYVESSPVSKVKALKTPKKLLAYLTEEETSLIVKSCKRVLDKLIIVLLITTGLRRNELVSLKISDIVGNHIIVNGKGSKQRKLILHPDVCVLLNQWLKIRNRKYGDSCEYLLISKMGKQFTGNAIRDKVKASMKRAGFSEERIQEIHTHSLRHTFVANLFESGADIFTAQSALGHSDLATTQIYAHLRNSALDRAMLNQKSIL